MARSGFLKPTELAHIRAAADRHPMLIHLRNTLMEKHGMGEKRARIFVERLIVGTFLRLGEKYHGEMSKRISRIFELRDKLSTIFDGAVKEGKLNVTPEHVEGMFREMSQEMQALKSPTESLGSEPNLVRDEIESQKLSDLVDETDETADIEPDLFPESKTGAPREPRTEASRGGDDVLLAKYWRDEVLRTQHQPTRDTIRQQVVDPFVNNHMPPGTQATMYSVDITQTAVRSAIDHLMPNDLFLPHGFEIQFDVGGTVFRPDGVRFVGGSNQHYMFREHKEPLAFASEHSLYAQDPLVLAGAPVSATRGELQKGIGDLREMLYKHARIAEQSQSRGCVGFEYSTGKSWLDKIIAEEIAYIKQKDPALGKYLHMAP